MKMLKGVSRSSVILRPLNINISKLVTAVEGDPKTPFSIVTTARCRGGRYFFHGFPHLTLDPYLIFLSFKQGGIKYHF